MAKIDLSQQYSNANDSLAVDFETKEPITLKKMLLQFCLSDKNEDGTPATGADKLARYALYIAIKKCRNTINLKAEEIAALKKAALGWPVLVIGQTHEMLEGTYKSPAQTDDSEAPLPQMPEGGPAFA